MRIHRQTEPSLGIEWRVVGFELYATDYGIGCHGYLAWDGDRVATIVAGSGYPTVLFGPGTEEAEDAWRVVAGRPYSAREGEALLDLLHDCGLWPTSPDWHPSTDELTELWQRAERRSTRESARRIVGVARSLT